MSKFSFCAALAAVVLCSVLAPVSWSQQGGGYPSQGNAGYPAQGNTGYQQYRPPTAPVASQPAGQPRMATPVVFLDMGRILEESSRIKAAKEALRADMKSADDGLIAEQESIRKLQEQLRQVNPGTMDYKQLEERIAKRISDLQVTAKLKRKEFGERQSQVLYGACKEIEQEVQSIAAERGILTVLRIASGDVPQENLEAVYAYAGRNVVYHHPSLDITNEVLARLERRGGYGNPNVSSRQGAGIPMQPMQPHRQ